MHPGLRSIANQVQSRTLLNSWSKQIESTVLKIDYITDKKSSFDFCTALEASWTLHQGSNEAKMNGKFEARFDATLALTSRIGVSVQPINMSIIMGDDGDTQVAKATSFGMMVGFGIEFAASAHVLGKVALDFIALKSPNEPGLAKLRESGRLSTGAAGALLSLTASSLDLKVWQHWFAVASNLKLHCGPGTLKGIVNVQSEILSEMTWVTF